MVFPYVNTSVTVVNGMTARLSRSAEEYCLHTSILALLGGFCLLRQARVQPCGRLGIVTVEHREQPGNVNKRPVPAEKLLLRHK